MSDVRAEGDRGGERPGKPARRGCAPRPEGAVVDQLVVDGHTVHAPQPEGAVVDQLVDAVRAQPHAHAVLVPAVSPGGSPGHAYLFHGPSGTGKRGVARAFAAALLAHGAPDPAAVARRVGRGSHPDLTWVVPSGASELLVGDVEEPVVAAAAHTPFESSRRVFVIEAAGTMNDQAANRMLKTLEEPPAFAHLILLAEHVEDVLATIASRCQLVRFDPLGSEQVREQLMAHMEGMDPERARACARLSGGDVALAEYLASEPGSALRACAQSLARCALENRSQERAWLGLLDGAKRAGEQAGEQTWERLREQGELLPQKERRKHEREGAEAVRRAERRGRARTLDLGLRLAELWLRDVWCVAMGVQELVFAVDRRGELHEDARGRSPATLGEAVEAVADTRLRLPLNVAEELALEALSYRIEALAG